ncbi:hypothetical protein TeGR_g1793 [Tetraparma gracilis]|uniref:TNFR-Cys domain-containing protein n=2 Tax=Tetraparma gracilis TaxID=2962635 RepID=A0ABQ6MGF7_9STRA|nr:hypothetical protein TeGR_g1793 [Tetraparma gracilis]
MLPDAMAQRPGLYAPLSPSHPPSSLPAAGERIEVALAMMDAYNSTVSNYHPTSAHDLALEVSATGYITGTNFTTTIEGEILYDKNSPAHASLTASVVIPYAGHWSVSVTQGTYNVQHFLGSPHLITVAAAATDPASCVVEIPGGRSITAGSSFDAIVETFDEFDNPTSHPEDSFKSRAELGNSEENFSNRHVLSSDHTFSELQTVAGAYKLYLYHANTQREVAGSPISFDVLPAAPSAATSTASAGNTASIVSAFDTALSLQVFVNDAFGNEVFDAPAVVVQVQGLNSLDPTAVAEHLLEGPRYSHTVTVPEGLEAALVIGFSLDGVQIGKPVEIIVAPPFPICPTGFVLFESECVECPEGTECAAPGVNVLTLPLEAGYWRASNESIEVLQCGEVEACTPAVCEDRNEEIEEKTSGAVEDCSYYEEYCEDDSPLVDAGTTPKGWVAKMCPQTCSLCEERGGGGEMCAANHVGPLCELCEDGFAAVQGSCVECEGGGSAVALAGVVVVLAMTAALVAWFVRRNGAKVKKWTHGSGMAAVKAVLAYSQILGSLSITMLVDFGPAFSGLTQVLAASNLDFVSFLPLDCVAPMDHHARLLGYTLGILVLDAVLLLVYKAAGKGKGGQVLMALFLVNSFLLPQVSMVIFSTFPCTKFDDDYGTYLTADKSIDCDGAAHAGMVAYATAMIFVFPVGKPLLCLYLLWRKRGEIDVGQDRLEKEHAGLHGNGATGLQEAVELRDKNEDIKHLAFLYESYQPKYWWYEVWETYRR